MNLQSRLNRLERASNFAPLPCPLCALSERHIDAAVELLGLEPLWSPGVAYSYNYVCEFCGVVSPRSATAPDEPAAVLFAAVLNALAERRLCAVSDSDLFELTGIYDRAARERLGADFHKWRALGDDFFRGVSALRADYTPRAPYVCRVAGCGCGRAEAAA